MKPKSINTIMVAALLAPGALFAQTTAKTTPVGYITHTIAGNVANEPGGVDTFITPTLVSTTTFAGAISAATSTSSGVATFASGVPAGLTDSYIVEVADGSSEGWWSRITSSTSTEIVAENNFPEVLPIGTKLIVRLLPTLNSFLGENTIGLTGSDTVQLLNPVTQTVTVAIYVSGEWQDFVTEANLDNTVILPGTSISVRRYAATDLTLVSTGEVKTTKTQVDIFSQDNWIGQTFAAGATFAQQDFVNTILPSDFIAYLNPNQTTDFYIKSGLEIINFVTESNADNFYIAPGQGFVIQRPSGSPSAITIPAQYVAP